MSENPHKCITEYFWSHNFRMLYKCRKTCKSGLYAKKKKVIRALIFFYLSKLSQFSFTEKNFYIFVLKFHTEQYNNLSGQCLRKKKSKCVWQDNDDYLSLYYYHFYFIFITCALRTYHTHKKKSLNHTQKKKVRK